MEFTRIRPHPDLEGFIECYWMMYSEDSVPQVEKIIPDGFTEIIFNYEHVYKSKTSGLDSTIAKFTGGTNQNVLLPPEYRPYRFHCHQTQTRRANPVIWF